VKGPWDLTIGVRILQVNGDFSTSLQLWFGETRIRGKVTAEKEKCKMKMKTTKFLAVLAVLAMAFTVIAFLPAQGQDAATGDGSSPLADGSTAYTDAAVTLGSLTFTPYVQPSATATYSDSTLTVGGYLMAESLTPRTNAWANAGFTETSWDNAALLSYAISFDSSKADTYHYYVYQENSVISGLKVTEITATAAAVDKATGANPSFEFALMNDTTPTTGITVKIIKSATAKDFAKTADEFNGYVAGDDVAVFNIAVASDKVNLTSTNSTEITGETTADITTEYSYVRSDATITKGTASTEHSADVRGLNFNNASAKLLIFPGKTLTINMYGTMATGKEATAILTTNALSIVGLSSTSKIVINDNIQEASVWANASGKYNGSSLAIGTMTKSALKDITISKVHLTVNGEESKRGFGIAGNAVTITNGAKVTITDSNRALQNKNSFTVSGSSTVVFNGGEAGIKGSGTITVGSSVAGDKSSFTATLFNPAGFNGGKDDRWGIRAEGATIIYAGSTITADGFFSKAADVTVNGTLKINASDLAGYYDIDATTKEVKGTFVPSGLVVAGAVGSSGYEDGKITTLAGKAVIITAGGVVNIAKGAYILGTIQDMATGNAALSSAVFGTVDASSATTAYYAHAILAKSNTTLNHGSVYINGELATPDESGKIAVTGNAEVSGVLDAGVTIELQTAETVLTVPSGQTLTVNGTINAAADNATVNVVGTANGTGKIGSTGSTIKVIAVSESAISGLEGDKATYTEPSNAELNPTGMTIDAIQEFLNNNLYVKIVTANISIAAGETLTLPSSLKLDLGGKAIVIADKGELDVNGAIIVDSVGGGYIEVGGIMVIDAADVCVDVKLDAGYKGYISVKNPKIMSVSGSLTSDVSVGYGNTMTLTDVTVPAGKNVFAYGKVVFEGTTIVKANANVYIYNYGSAEVNGSLYIEGSASSTSSSFTVNGLLEISNDNGAATMTAKAIYNMGTISIVKPRSSTAVNSNALTATTVYNYSTMRVTGEFAGKIYDFGDLTFNGTNTSADTKIVLADGVTFTLTSVTGQPLTVMDEGSYTTMPDAFLEYSTTPKAYVAVSAGNAVVLKDVKNVTFTESVSVKIVEGKYAGETANIRCFTANLTVAGSIVATDDSSDDYKTIGMTGMATYKMDHAIDSNYKVSITKGLVIVDDMTVGKNVELTMNAGVKVSGTLTATAKTSRVVAADADNKVDVTGTIVIGDECGKTGAAQGLLVNTNSAYYEVTDLDSKTYTYYTTLKTALDNASFADDDNIGLLGAVSIKKAELIVPAGITLRLAEGSKLTISSTGSLEVEKDALLNAINGEVVVDGVLQINDKNTGFRFNAAKLTYQVYVENGDMAAYCGLLGALASAEPGDIITLVQSKTVKESFTIPAGVVVIVPTNVELTLGSDSSKIKMTVDGSLVLERNSKLTKADPSQEVIIAISGQIVKDTDATITATAQTTTAGKFTLNDYATYTGKIEGRDTLFYSNLTDAIENATSGYVTVYGKVSAGEVTLTKGETATTLDLIMVGSSTAPAVISVVSLTLDGSSITISNNQYTTFNGTIIAASGDDYGEIIMSNAYNFTVVSGYEVTSSGNVDYMELSGIPGGSVMISDGTVTAANNLALTGNSNGTFILDEDAILYVPEDCSVALGSDVADAEYNIIDGSVVVEKGTLYLGSAIVSGSISIIESTTSVVELPVLLYGSIITVSTDDNKALLTIDDNASIIMGDRPEILADTPVLAGDFAIENGAYILIYEGDISLAKMNWNSATEKSDVKSTSFYINDELFCIAIGGSSPTVDLVNDDGTIYDTIIYDVFELEGLDTSKIATASEWKNIEGRSIGVQYIGYTDAIFFKADAAIAKGTVSVGVGLVLYIDGVGYNYYGGDNVKLTVGTHSVRYEVDYGYIGDNVVLTFNGKTIPVTATGATIDVTPDMVEDGFFVSATGATPAPEPEPVVPEKESEWTITTILLCVLVVLIAIMAVIVALRLNRN